MKSKQPNSLRLNVTKPTGTHGFASEKRVAKDMGGKLTPGSGALKGAKGDSLVNGFMVESKSTINATMSLEHGWLVKVAEEALATAKTPALTVSFVTGDGKSKRHGDWVMVPLHVWRELTE